MKILGWTDSSGLIVEFTREEGLELKRLIDACKGKLASGYWDDMRPYAGFSEDVAVPLKAIAAWTTLRFDLNEMQKVIGAVHKAVGEEVDDSE